VKPVPETGAGEATPWTELFSAFIRQNDLAIMEACRKVLKEFEEDLLVCDTWQEMFDVLGFLDEVSEPQEFLRNLLNAHK